MEDGLVGAGYDHFAGFAGLAFDADYVGGGKGYFGVHVAVLAHPAVVENFGHVTGAGIGHEGDDHVALFRGAGDFQGGGDAAAAGAAGEDGFLFGEAARPDETFFVADLVDVVENFQIHGAREKIFADAFDDIGEGFAGVAGFYFFVVERADGVHADYFDFGILFFQVAAYAGDGAAGAYAADEVGDFSFGVLPDFGAGGAVVRFGVHGIFVLIGVEGIGNFAGQFCGDGIVAARIFGLDGGGADDYFCTEGFQQVNFFTRLLVGDGEDDFVATDAGDQGQAHAGVAGGAFDDGAAGF